MTANENGEIGALLDWTEIITRTLKLPHNIYNNETYKITTILRNVFRKSTSPKIVFIFHFRRLEAFGIHKVTIYFNRARFLAFRHRIRTSVL